MLAKPSITVRTQKKPQSGLTFSSFHAGFFFYRTCFELPDDTQTAHSKGPDCSQTEPSEQNFSAPKVVLLDNDLRFNVPM